MILNRRIAAILLAVTGITQAYFGLRQACWFSGSDQLVKLSGSKVILYHQWVGFLNQKFFTTVTTYDLSVKKKIDARSYQDRMITPLCCSRGRVIVEQHSSAKDSEIVLYDSGGGQIVGRRVNDGLSPEEVALSADEKRIAVAKSFDISSKSDLVEIKLFAVAGLVEVDSLKVSAPSGYKIAHFVLKNGWALFSFESAPQLNAATGFTSFTYAYHFFSFESGKFTFLGQTKIAPTDLLSDMTQHGEAIVQRPDPLNITQGTWHGHDLVAGKERFLAPATAVHSHSFDDWKILRSNKRCYEVLSRDSEVVLAIPEDRKASTLFVEQSENVFVNNPLTFYCGNKVELWSINGKRLIATTDFEAPFRTQYILYLVVASVWAIAWSCCCLNGRHQYMHLSAGFLLAVASAILYSCAAVFDSSSQIWTQLASGLIVALLVVIAISTIDSQACRLQTIIIIVMLCVLAWAVRSPFRFEVMAAFLASTVLLILMLAILQRMQSAGQRLPTTCERNVSSRSSFSILTLLAIVTAVALMIPSLRLSWQWTASFSAVWTVALTVQIVVIGASSLAAAQTCGTNRNIPIVILVVSLVASWRIQDLLPFSWQDTDYSGVFRSTNAILTEPLIPLATMMCVVGGLASFTNTFRSVRHP